MPTVQPTTKLEGVCKIEINITPIFIAFFRILQRRTIKTNFHTKNLFEKNWASQFHSWTPYFRIISLVWRNFQIFSISKSLIRNLSWNMKGTSDSVSYISSYWDFLYRAIKSKTVILTLFLFRIELIIINKLVCAVFQPSRIALSKFYFETAFKLLCLNFSNLTTGCIMVRLELQF